MNKKGYFGILITAFTMLIVMRQQNVEPNQEIVVEFINIETTSTEAQNVIAVVKKQLQTIGVKNTRISKDIKNGKLKIAYYSEANIESIKKLLSEKQDVDSDRIVYQHTNNKDKELPSEKNVKDYKLDICEIQQSTDVGFDANSKFVLQIKQKRDGDFDTNLYSIFPHEYIRALGYNKNPKEIYTVIVCVLSNTIHNIPEVRAGPIS